MSSSGQFKDPLAFGATDDEVLEDLTAHLNQTLAGSPGVDHVTLGGSMHAGADDPLAGYHATTGLIPGMDSNQGPLYGTSADNQPPSHSYLSGGHNNMSDPLATYGQLVTPNPQAPAATTGSSSSGGSGNPPAQAAAARLSSNGDGAGGLGPGPAPTSSLPGSSGASRQTSLGALLGSEASGDIASPHLPEAVAKPCLLAITVGDPVKKDSAGVFGMKASHVEYLVSTRSSLEGWSPAEASVRRRFKDFVALADVLKARFRGYFVPPRPEKNAVEGQRMSDAFIEDRRSSLEKYLRKLASHPVIGPSEELKLFLTITDDLAISYQWQSMQPPSATVMESTAKFGMQLIGRESKVVDPVAAAQPAAARKDLMRAMKEAATGMRGGREVSVEELEMRRGREVMEEMAAQLATTSRAAERVIDKLDKLGAVHGDLGLSLFKVAKFEEAEGGPLATSTGTIRYSSSLIADEKRAAAALVRISKMCAKVTGRTAQEMSALHGTLAFMPAVVRGLMSREHQLLTCHTLEGDLEARKKSLHDLEAGVTKVTFGGDRAKQKQIEDLRLEISRLEISIGVAKGEYDKIKTANNTETARFISERRAEYMSMVENLAATQVAASERFLEVWLQVARELGASQEQLAAVRQPAKGVNL